MSDETDPLLLLLQTFLGQATFYFALVGLTFLAVWRLGERRFRARRIQEKRRVNGKQLRHEVKHTLVTLAIGTVNALVITLLYQAGWTALSNDLAEWSWPTLVLSLVGMIAFNDAWFYGWHRFLHRPGVFKYAHAVHHKSVDVNPFSSYSFHAIEAFTLGAWSIPLLMFVPLYVPVLAALQVVGLVNNIVAHLGYEFMPRWFIRVPPFKWLTTSTYHNLHHTRLDGNYALFFRFWDRLLGTEVPDYEQTFLARGGAAASESCPRPTPARRGDPGPG